MAQLSTDEPSDGSDFLHPGSIRPILPALLDVRSAVAVGDWFGTLADPTRARILQALTLADELCVVDLARALGMSISALSHQLAYLRERGVVVRRKDGRRAHYSLADDHVRHVLSDAIDHLREPARS